MRYDSTSLAASINGDGKNTDARDVLPIENLEKGLIKRTDGRYVKILEAFPTNFHFKNQDEQERMIYRFQSWLNQAPNKFQINILSQKIKTKVYASNIQGTLKDTTNTKLKQRAKECIRDIEASSQYSMAIDKKYYLSYEYDPDMDDGDSKKDFDKIAEAMQVSKHNTLSSFQQIGCNIRDDKPDDIINAEVLYDYLNPVTTNNESLEDRMERIKEDITVLEEVDYADTVLNFIAPKTYNNTNPDFVYLDGEYKTFLYATSHGYPVKVCAAWMDVVTQFGQGVDVALHFRKGNADEAIALTSDRLKWTGNALRNLITKNKHSQQIDAGSKYDEAMYLLNSLKAGQDLWWCSMIITISGHTYADMKQKMLKVRKSLRKTLKLVQCKNGKCVEAFRMSLPICYTSKKIVAKSKRNLPTESAAAMFPFTSLSLFSNSGVPIGINLTDNSLAVYDPFKYINPNMLMFGASGIGKTYAQLLLGYRYRYMGMQCIYVLPLKGFQARHATEEIGGEYIKLGPGMRACINIMGILPEKEYTGTDYEEVAASSYLSKKITEIKTFISLNMQGTMKVYWEFLLDDILVHLYEDFGINSDNSSIWDRSGKLKKMPVIEDLYDRIKDNQELKEVASSLKIFVSGSCKNMNGQTNVDLENPFTVFDVDSEQIPASLHPTFLFLANNIAYARAKANDKQRVMVFMDEVWKMMINKLAANFVFEMVKLIRGYGGGIVIATQDIQDFMRVENKNINDGIIGNTATKIILGMEPKGLKVVKEELELTPNECDQLVNYQQGQALFIANKVHLPIYLKATPEEHKIFTAA